MNPICLNLSVIAQILFVIAAAPAWSQQPVALLKPILGGRAYGLAIGSSNQLALPQPITVTFASTSAGDSQIGFTHSGYSSSNLPKNANFLAAVDLQNQPLSEDEKRQILNSAFILQEGLVTARNLELDISLPINAAEESRLRTQAGLPKRITFGSLNLVNLRWTGVRGRTLYEWLTRPDGLSIVIRGTVDFETDKQHKLLVDSQRLTDWWSSSVGDLNVDLFLVEGISALSVELLNKRIIYSSFELGSSANPIEDIASATATQEKLAQLAHVTPTGWSIKYSDIKKLQGAPIGSVSFRFKLPVQTGIAPGATLLSHPEFVVDQSGNSSGLSSLLNDR